MFTLNLWAIILSAIASMTIGAFWYSPKGFGKTWMQLKGLNSEECKPENRKGMAKSYILTFVSTLIAATALNAVLSGFTIMGVLNGALTGALAWLGFSLTTALPGFMFNTKKQPWTLFVIDNGLHLVSWVVSAVIITLLK